MPGLMKILLGRRKFSNGYCDLILLPININVVLILHTKFQPNIHSHFGEMNLNAWVDVNLFRVDLNFQTAIVTYFRYIFFFILISFNIKVLLILQTKFQPNIPILDQTKFYYSEALESDHAAYEI